MMNINQSVLANAVINITGNTRGLESAIGETKKQMHGFMVFAQAMGGKTGGFLANMLAGGAGAPLLHSVLGQRIGGNASALMSRMGILRDPIGDIDAAMNAARSQYRNAVFAHKMAGANIFPGGVYNGQPITTARQARIARIRHAQNAPQMATFTQNIVHGAASSAQNLAMTFGKIGFALMAATTVFKKLAESGMELDRQMKRASRVFGSSLGGAMSGYGAFGANMSRAQYVGAASGIGAELNAQGVGRGQSSQMSAAMTRRAGQIAAAWGADFEDVAGKIQSALGGSNAALKEFGITLSDDIVRAKAFNSGMIGYLEHMSDAVAAQARFNLILQQADEAVKNASSSFFDLGHQWTVTTSGFSSLMQQLGAVVSPVAAGILGVANAFLTLQVAINDYVLGTLRSASSAFLNAVGLGGGGDAGVDKQKMLTRADNDAKRAQTAIDRERARQSSNVGYHRPEDFYNTIQKGIFGDPVEFQKRQTDLMYEFVVVSKEMRDALRDFGYKVTDASGLLAP